MFKAIIEDWMDFTCERNMTKDSVIRFAYRKTAHIELNNQERVLVMYGSLMGSPFVEAWSEANTEITMQNVMDFINKLKIE